MVILPITTWVLPWGTLEAAREAHLGPALLSQHQHPHPAAMNEPNKPFPTGTTARSQAVSENENGSDLVLDQCTHATGVSHKTVWESLGRPDVPSKQAFPTVHHKTRCCCFSRALQHMLILTGTMETGGVSICMDSTHLWWPMGESPLKIF